MRVCDAAAGSLVVNAKTCARLRALTFVPLFAPLYKKMAAAASGAGGISPGKQLFTASRTGDTSTVEKILNSKDASAAIEAAWGPPADAMGFDPLPDDQDCPHKDWGMWASITKSDAKKGSSSTEPNDGPGNLADSEEYWSSSKEKIASPLHIAARYGHAKVITALLKAGYDANQHSKEEMECLQPIEIAVRNKHTEASIALLKAGASPKTRYFNGSTMVLLWAAANGMVEVLAASVEAGWKLSAVNHDGYSALYAAARFGQPDTLVWLINNGARFQVSSETSFPPGVMMATAALNDYTVSLAILVKAAGHATDFKEEDDEEFDEVGEEGSDDEEEEEEEEEDEDEDEDDDEDEDEDEDDEEDEDEGKYDPLSNAAEEIMDRAGKKGFEKNAGTRAIRDCPDCDQQDDCLKAILAHAEPEEKAAIEAALGKLKV